jgi:hypothetical protein
MQLLALPFVALWQLLGFVLSVAGRLSALVIGIVLVLVGIVLTLTVVGGIVGIPLILLGLLLTARGLF